eukprot:TRINITY_DN1824_c0_g1_i1.p1 TRINITY_DN1824_c0_g1~~TRINITY_DN1824_c0_g1_i1.p1  ORF type:complete len:622 (+),score=109.40 TRINITY_DN1824_c0_g1_i1:235-2100(+)
MSDSNSRPAEAQKLIARDGESSAAPPATLDDDDDSLGTASRSTSSRSLTDVLDRLSVGTSAANSPKTGGRTGSWMNMQPIRFRSISAFRPFAGHADDDLRPQTPSPLESGSDAQRVRAQSMSTKPRQSRVPTHHVLGCAPPDHEGPLFEQFVVAGMTKETYQGIDHAHNPALIFQYPQPSDRSNPLPDAPKFCFPSGVVARKVKITASGSSINALRFSQSSLYLPSQSFVFAMVGEGAPLYGVCVIQDELLTEPALFLTDHSTDPVSLRQPPRSLEDSSYAIVAPRVYCLITKYPFFKFHFDLLYHLLANDKLKRHFLEAAEPSTSDTAMSPGPATTIFEQSLIDTMRVLSSVHTLRIPRPGESIYFQFPIQDLGSLTLLRYMDESRLFGEWALEAFCRQLSLPNIVAVLNAALLERTMIFYSSNLGLVSRCVMAVMSLLRPFVWPHPIFPILPTHFLGYLQMPCPFIAGVQNLPESVLNSKHVQVNALAVDIEGDALTPYGEIKIPALPDRDRLIKNLRPSFDVLRQALKSRNTQTAASAGEAFATQVRNYVSWILKQISMKLRDLPPSNTPADLLNTARKHLPQKVDQSNREFISAFVETGMFGIFSEQFFDDIAAASP